MLHQRHFFATLLLMLFLVSSLPVDAEEIEIDGILDEDEVEAVRAYVIDAANSERTAAFYESIGKPTVEQESQTEADAESDSEENAGG